MKPKAPFHRFQPLAWCALLFFVLCAHWLGLVYVQGHLVGNMSLASMPEPLFVRMLQPVAAIAPQVKRRDTVVVPLKSVPRVAGTPIAAEQVSDGVSSLPSDAELVPSDAREAQVPDPAPELAATVVEPINAVTDAWPVDTRLSYSVKGYYRGDFYGSGRVQWQHKDGQYQVQVDGRMALFFTGTLISQGELSAQGLRPRLYEERALGRVRRASFDGVDVTFHEGNTLPQPDGVQDTASQFVELTQRFSSGRQELVVGAVVSVWLARPRQMNLWVYDVVALETLQIEEFGAVPAFHLQPRQVANPGGLITADLWFAPGLQYLPVRIRINAGNDNYADLVVNRIEQGGEPVNDRR